MFFFLLALGVILFVVDIISFFVIYMQKLENTLFHFVVMGSTIFVYLFFMMLFVLRYRSYL